MTMEEFNPIYLVMDEERSRILEYISRTALATKHGNTLNDVGRDRLFEAIADLDRIENAYEQAKSLESTIEACIHDTARYSTRSHVIEAVRRDH